jgi:hypothetical protein
VREGRKYGFSLIVASQNPSDVHRSIFASAGTVLSFRLTLASERDYLRASLSYSDFFERQSHTLSVGQPLVHLEFASPQPRGGTFLLGRVDGEEQLVGARIKGDGMDLEFEKGELLRRLISSGLSDRQSASVLSEFQRRSYSLSAEEFVSVLEKFGYGRAFTVSVLRELGAGEKEMLSIFSSAEKRKSPGSRQSAVLLLRESQGADRGRKKAKR